MSGGPTENHLFQLCALNRNTRKPNEAALTKYVHHLSETETIDVMPFFWAGREALTACDQSNE